MNPPTDFWGIVVPGWIGALSGLIGGVVAVVSLIIAVRSKQTADAARAAGSRTRSVVADTISELQRSDDDDLQTWLETRRAQTQGLAAPVLEEQDVRARHTRRSARYDALLRRLDEDEPPVKAAG